MGRYIDDAVMDSGLISKGQQIADMQRPGTQPSFPTIPKPAVKKPQQAIQGIAIEGMPAIGRADLLEGRLASHGIEQIRDKIIVESGLDQLSYEEVAQQVGGIDDQRRPRAPVQ